MATASLKVQDAVFPYNVGFEILALNPHPLMCVLGWLVTMVLHVALLESSIAQHESLVLGPEV